ncbi:hypothetical protein AAFF_G00280240 [Aldrovandia affinis]|uniref:Transmembrane protein 26 n=1 Tax=Aldrovandia affinis TaxID=143900 RepID=A0AAD7W213_9TELE|nr:hypothetical protein AAFF_G00280240 [Aldrovandia affinis]
MNYTFPLAILIRILSIVLSHVGIWRVTVVENNNLFWLLVLLCLPLFIEMIVSIKARKGEGYRSWSPAILLLLLPTIPSIWLLELQHQNKDDGYQCHLLENIKNRSSLNETMSVDAYLSSLEELAQLVLTVVHPAGDILVFTNETILDLNEKSHGLVYAILAVWTCSMLQFPINLSASRREESIQGRGDRFILRRRADMWSIVVSLFIQDGPFLVVRLVAMLHYKIFHQRLVFFAIKNLVVVLVNVCLLHNICHERKEAAKVRRDYISRG